MSEPVKKITVNVPERLLKKAQEGIGGGPTEAVIAGLQELEKRQKRTALRGLKGKVAFDLNLEKERE